MLQDIECRELEQVILTLLSFSDVALASVLHKVNSWNFEVFRLAIVHDALTIEVCELCDLFFSEF